MKLETFLQQLDSVNNNFLKYLRPSGNIEVNGAVVNVFNDVSEQFWVGAEPMFGLLSWVIVEVLLALPVGVELA